MRHHLIRRDRLIRRLADAVRAPLCVIDAPVGFGKSVLIGQFLETESREHILYEVAPNTTLGGFARGFADALSTRDPGARLSFASAYDRAAQSKQPSAHLAYWLIEHARDLSLTIVVDGLNDAADDPATMDFLVRLIDATHEHLHWIVATRSTALLRIPSWMANGVMERSIDITELRFNSDEIANLARAYDPDLSFIRNGSLPKSSWPAGVDFSLFSAHEMGRSIADIKDGDYESLSAQLFAIVPVDARQLLVATCLLNIIDEHVAVEVVDRDAGTILRQLRATFPWMFSVSGSLLRYHDRFRAFLHAQLASAGVESAAMALKVADILDTKGHVAEALMLLTQFPHAAKLTEIVERHGFDLIDSGDAEVVGSALAILGRPTDKNPIVMAVRAMLDARLGRSDTAEAWYRLAIDALADDPRRGDIVYRYAHELARGYRVDWIDLLKPCADADALSDDTRAMRCSLLAQGYSIAGDRDLAAAYLREALAFASRSESAVIHATVDGRAAFIAMNEGDGAIAKSYAIRAAERAVANDLYDLAAPLYTVLFVIAYDIEDDALASFEYLGRIAAYSIKSGNIQQNLWALAARYGLLMERGEETAATHLSTSLHSFDLHYLSPAFADALLPSQALSASWRGDFTHAHALLLPSAETQTDPERRALRWAEVAFYAAGAGLLNEARHELSSAEREIKQCDEITPRLVRAEVLLAFANFFIDDIESGDRILDRVKQLQSHTVRMHALAGTLETFADWWRSDRHAMALTRSLERLENLQLGGFARSLEAVPISAARTARLRSENSGR